MGIFEQIIAVCKGHEGEKFSSNEIKNKVEKQFGIKRGSILPPDYCYNRINDGINFTHHFFEEINGIYKYLGPNYLYTGMIKWKQRGCEERIVGKWESGKIYLWEYFPKVDRDLYFPDMKPVDETSKNWSNKSHAEVNVNQKTIYSQAIPSNELTKNFFSFVESSIKQKNQDYVPEQYDTPSQKVYFTNLWGSICEYLDKHKTDWQQKIINMGQVPAIKDRENGLKWTDSQIF